MHSSDPLYSRFLNPVLYVTISTLSGFFQFMEVLQQVEEPASNLGALIDTFNDQGVSDYLVVYLRLLTSGQLQKDSEFYQNFIEGDRSVKDFCNQV